MSLQIWLPLNGNLNNQGLTNISITNNGTTVNNDGKIGKAIEFGANKYIKLDNYASTFLTYNTWSLSVWFKCTAQNTSHTGSALISGGNWNQAANLLILALGNFSSNKYTTLFVSGSGGWNKGYNYNFLLNQWYHVTLTSGNGKMRAYVNGQLIGDSYNAFKPTTLEQTWICIGNGTYSQSFHFYGLMNDIRIYDHCLSPKEVEELSKGLILHYKLNKSFNLINSNVYQWTNFTLGQWYYQIASIPMSDLVNLGLKTGDKITYSVDVKATSGQKILCLRLQQYNSSSDRPNTYSINTIQPLEEGRLQVTAILDTNYASVQLLIGNSSSSTVTSNTTEQWKCIKLEIGDIATPWEFSGENNVIADCSGYNNNGVINGTLSTVAGDSPRYDCSTYISSGNTDYIITTETIGNPSDAITMNIWFKSSCTTPGSNYHEIFNHATNVQAFEFAINKDGYFRQGMLVDGTRYVVNSSSSYALLDGNWHMLTATYDGISIKRYIDGTIVDTMTQTISGSLTGANGKFLLGHYGTNTSYYTKETYISDARIYATALSAAAIKELYDTSGSIDAQGNIYARELVE